MKWANGWPALAGGVLGALLSASTVTLAADPPAKKDAVTEKAAADKSAPKRDAPAGKGGSAEKPSSADKPGAEKGGAEKGGAADKAGTDKPAPADKGHGGAEKSGDGHGKEAHWSYSGDSGPEDWGRLKSDYLVCYTGKQQSPIDIRKTVSKNLPALTFNYVPSKLNVVNNGHTIQYNFDAGSTLEADGKKYDLVQTHFHTPSEHALNGKRFPAEFHLVHKAQDGKLAVVGVMLEASAASNPGYKKFLAAAPGDAGEERRNPNVLVSPADLLPKSRAYVTYPGSLTTPPCTEGVSWYVLVKPAEVAATQIEELKRLYAGNARPLQRLNEREPLSPTTSTP